MRLRAYLILMSAAVLIPVVGFHAGALMMLVSSERHTTFTQLEENFAGAGRDLKAAPLEEMEEEWRRIKSTE